MFVIMLKPINALKALTTISLVSLCQLSYLVLAPMAQAKHETGSSSIRTGLPERRVGGGGRIPESCLAPQQSLVALIPENLKGFTAASSPDIFVYLPSTDKAKSVEFVLRNSNDDIIYEHMMFTHHHSGIVKFNVPEIELATNLGTNQEYHWYVSLICNPLNRAEDFVVEGLIERIDLKSEVAEQLATATTMEKVQLYQQESLWHDALATLMESQFGCDVNVNPVWISLLESVNLPIIVDRPFENCLQAKVD